MTGREQVIHGAWQQDRRENEVGLMTLYSNQQIIKDLASVKALPTVEEPSPKAHSKKRYKTIESGRSQTVLEEGQLRSVKGSGRRVNLRPLFRYPKAKTAFSRHSSADLVASQDSNKEEPQMEMKALKVGTYEFQGVDVMRSMAQRVSKSKETSSKSSGGCNKMQYQKLIKSRRGQQRLEAYMKGRNCIAVNAIKTDKAQTLEGVESKGRRCVSEVKVEEREEGPTPLRGKLMRVEKRAERGRVRHLKESKYRSNLLLMAVEPMLKEIGSVRKEGSSGGVSRFKELIRGYLNSKIPQRVTSPFPPTQKQ